MEECANALSQHSVFMEEPPDGLKNSVNFGPESCFVQIYLPAPRRVQRPKFDMAVPNEVHQGDLRRWCSLTLQRGLADLQAVDPRRKFMGVVSQLLAKHRVKVRCGRVDIHRDQGVLEHWNWTLAERLFGHQYAQEMCLPLGQRSTEWVAWLPSIIAALNSEVTGLTGKKPSDAIKAKTMVQKPSSVVLDCPVGLKEQKLPSGIGVRYLYQPGELEGGRCRATDPVWSFGVYRLGRSVTKPCEPVLYYL